MVNPPRRTRYPSFFVFKSTRKRGAACAEDEVGGEVDGGGGRWTVDGGEEKEREKLQRGPQVIGVARWGEPRTPSPRTTTITYGLPQRRRQGEGTMSI